MQTVNLNIGFATGHILVHKGNQFADGFRIGAGSQNNQGVRSRIGDNLNRRCGRPALLKNGRQVLGHFGSGSVLQGDIRYLISGSFNIQRVDNFLQPFDVGQIICNDQHAGRRIGKYRAGLGDNRIQDPLYFVGVGAFQGDDLGGHAVFRSGQVSSDSRLQVFFSSGDGRDDFVHAARGNNRQAVDFQHGKKNLINILQGNFLG